MTAWEGKVAPRVTFAGLQDFVLGLEDDHEHVPDGGGEGYDEPHDGEHADEQPARERLQRQERVAARHKGHLDVRRDEQLCPRRRARSRDGLSLQTAGRAVRDAACGFAARRGY